MGSSWLMAREVVPFRGVGQIAQAGILSSKAGEGVLDDSVLHVVLAELVAQSGILSHGDALVIHQHTAGGVLQLFGQFSHNGFLLFQNRCVRHFGFTSRE